MNAPGQKIAAAQEIRIIVRPGFWGIGIPNRLYGFTARCARDAEKGKVDFSFHFLLRGQKVKNNIPAGKMALFFKTVVDF